MQVLKGFLVVLVLLAGMVALIGAALPPDHTVTRTVVVPAAPEQVFALISHVQDYPHWRTGVSRVDILPEQDGQFHWVEETTMGKVPQLLTENDPISKRVVTIDDAHLPFGGTWTFELAPDGTATRLTITENGHVGNVFLRFANKYIFGQSTTIDQYETDLVRALQ